MNSNINKYTPAYLKALELKRSKKIIKVLPTIKYLLKDRSMYYKRVGNTVTLGQGCIFVGQSNERLESVRFDTCAAFVMWTGEKGKRVLGHIDGTSTPEEIVRKIQDNFSIKEIERASFHYYRGADKLNPNPTENLGIIAQKTIESALDKLGVKGKYEGELKSGYDKVIVDAEGIRVQEYNIS